MRSVAKLLKYFSSFASLRHVLVLYSNRDKSAHAPIKLQL